MFKCGMCGETSSPREKANRIVTEYREASYKFIPEAHTFVKEGKKEVRDDPGGSGVEVAKEILVCQTCTSNLSLLGETA